MTDRGSSKQDARKSKNKGGKIKKKEKTAGHHSDCFRSPAQSDKREVGEEVRKADVPMVRDPDTAWLG